MWPTWGPPGADRTQVGPMLVTWTELSGSLSCEAHPLKCFHHLDKIFITMAALKFVKMTTFSAADEENFVKITIFIQCRQQLTWLVTVGPYLEIRAPADLPCFSAIVQNLWIHRHFSFPWNNPVFHQQITYHTNPIVVKRKVGVRSIQPSKYFLRTQNVIMTWSLR